MAFWLHSLTAVPIRPREGLRVRHAPSLTSSDQPVLCQLASAIKETVFLAPLSAFT